jgi:hypothetical protein
MRPKNEIISFKILRYKNDKIVQADFLLPRFFVAHF